MRSLTRIAATPCHPTIVKCDGLEPAWIKAASHQSYQSPLFLNLVTILSTEEVARSYRGGELIACGRISEKGVASVASVTPPLSMRVTACHPCNGFGVAGVAEAVNMSTSNHHRQGVSE